MSPWSGAETWRGALLLTAAGGAFGALSIVFLRAHRADDVAVTADPLETASMWQYVRQHRMAVVSVFCAFGLGGMGLSAVSTWMPVIVERRFGATAPSFALAY